MAAKNRNENIIYYRNKRLGDCTRKIPRILEFIESESI